MTLHQQPGESQKTVPLPAGDRLTEDQLRLQVSALNATTSGLLVTDLQGTILWVNPAFTHMTGYVPAELIGRKPSLLKSGKQDEAFYRNLWATIKAGKIWRGEIINRRKDGSDYVDDMTITPVRNRAGHITHFVASKQDITAHKQSEQQLRQINQDLARGQIELLAVDEQLRATQAQLVEAEKSASIARLAAGVAHEVRNPLAVLLMGIGCLEDNLRLDDRLSEIVLHDMRDAVERADAIVRELLDFSTPRPLALAVEDLNTVIDHALRLVRHEWTKRGIEVIREFGPTLPPVRIDRIRIGQVFLNLFTNAIHAMPRGGSLTVRTWAKAPGLVGAEVLDTGSGIPTEHLIRIFDPFFTTKPAGVGTGLGLAVAKNILAQHGGQLALANRPTGGVCATVTLPHRRETDHGTQTNPLGG
jgi:PAS domain S-box-containing protein